MTSDEESDRRYLQEMIDSFKRKCAERGLAIKEPLIFIDTKKGLEEQPKD